MKIEKKKHVVSKIRHNEYNNVLLNNKFLRHSTNRIQSKNHKIGITRLC